MSGVLVGILDLHSYLGRATRKSPVLKVRDRIMDGAGQIRALNGPMFPSRANGLDLSH